MENEVKNSANASEDLVALRSENEKLKAEIKNLKQILEQLMEQLRLARHKRFGASSEKNTEAEQLSIFNEAEIYEDAEKAEEKLTVVAGHTRRKKKEYTLLLRVKRGLELQKIITPLFMKMMIIIILLNTILQKTK